MSSRVSLAPRELSPTALYGRRQNTLGVQNLEPLRRHTTIFIWFLLIL
jgi:hypothetical protein